METIILATVNGTEYPDLVLAVAQITKGFSVVGFDTDAEMFLNFGGRIFKNADDAFEYAFAEID